MPPLPFWTTLALLSATLTVLSEDALVPSTVPEVRVIVRVLAVVVVCRYFAPEPFTVMPLLLLIAPLGPSTRSVPA